MIKFLVSAILCVAVATGSKVTINITSTSEGDTLVYRHNFTFSCTASSNVTLKAVIDGHDNGHKFDRLKNATIAKKNETKFTFQSTLPSDDGTTFQCEATVNGTKYTSSLLKLHVEYPPIFASNHSNGTILHQIHSGKDAELNCDVTANPPTVNFHFTNNSKDSNGVTTKVDKDQATITFTKAKVDNRGAYTCSANNTIGTTTLTYNTYIGDVPKKDTRVNCSSVVEGENQVYSCSVNDTNDAPITALSLNISGDLVKNKVFTFNESDLPITGTFKVLSVDLVDEDPGNHTLTVTAINLLGQTEIIRETTFIHGLNTHVTISSASNFTVVEGNAFNFTCSSTRIHASYDVFINAKDSGKDHQRLSPTTKTNLSQSFSFANTGYKDNGHTIQCVVRNPGYYQSDPMSLNVQFAPKYLQHDVKGTPVNNTKAVIDLPGYIANPSNVANVTWKFNGSVLKDNTLPNQLVFDRVLLKDKGDYTVHTCNSIGCGDGAVSIDVYWLPVVSLPTLGQAIAGHEYSIEINITSAYPKVTESEWISNGHVILDGSRVTPGLSSLKFDKLEQIDNGTYQYSVKNAAGFTNVSFSLSVEFAPNITIPKMSGGHLDTASKVDISYEANPPPSAVKWYFNDSVISNTNKDGIKVSDTSLSFSKLKKENNGTYTVSVTNNVTTTNASFDFWVYYGPEFSQNTNGSQWIEIRTNDTYNITCIVKDSNPPVIRTNFTFKGSNKNVHIFNYTNNVTLEIIKANQSNRLNYTCEAETMFTKSHSVFQTFVGDLPDKVSIKKFEPKYKGSGSDTTITVQLEISDSSLAPARNITYNIKGNKTNTTIVLKKPILSKPMSFNILGGKVSAYGAERVTVLFYASNDFGTFCVGSKNITLSEPSAKKKSHTVAIAVGVAVPVVAILLLIAAIAGGWYYNKKKKDNSAHYSPLNVQDGNGYGATN